MIASLYSCPVYTLTLALTCHLSAVFLRAVKLPQKCTIKSHVKHLRPSNHRAGHSTPLYPQKLALNLVYKWRSLSRYSSLAD
jgi:hypothetical protein